MEKKEDNGQKVSQMEEDKLEKEKTGEKSKNKSEEDMETSEEEGSKISTTGDFTPTYKMSRGTDSLVGRQEFSPIARQRQEVDTSLSLQAIQLSDSCSSQLPVLTQLSHQLCEQLRLILEPTKAAKLQGDFRTGKRLNMRKIIPYIASQFKKDKIWLRRVKPNKRDFQFLVALDDSSSMSDNQSREIALSSLNTLSSALSLLEVGQLGVLRFGKAAEIIHSLGVQWSQSAGQKIQNQFTFEQKETSLVSLLNLFTQLFTTSSSSSSRNLSVSQLLIIVSDGGGFSTRAGRRCCSP
jgi:midasin